MQKKINELHTGTDWECKIIQTEGDLLDDAARPLAEEHKLWIRDPVDCIRELIGNPAFCDHMAFTCQQVYTDSEGKKRVYDEMWTGDWWWKTQVSIGAHEVQ